MNHFIPNHSDLSHPILQRHLYPVAKSLRQIKALKRRVRFLLGLCGAAAVAAALGFAFPPYAEFVFLAVAVSIGVVLFLSWQREQRETLDYLEAARNVEARFPELKQSLVTAVERELLGDHSFLSRRVVRQALESPNRNQWEHVARPTLSRIRIQYLVTLALLFIPIAASYFAAQREVDPTESGGALANQGPQKLVVEPGDTEVEKGSSLVVTARFEGPVPEKVSLKTTSDVGETSIVSMARSLSDPVFAYSLRRLERNVNYEIVYGDAQSEPYRIEVYELPELLSADADLNFPGYTEWKSRRIEDTLRISAIEGTQLSYQFNLNKPVVEAFLESASGERLELNASNAASTQFTFDRVLQQSDTYTLHLLDGEGRSNVYPPEVRIDTILNQRPDLRIDSPRGDQRFTALQEVRFQGTASDDFGLLDYGIAFVLADSQVDEISLREEAVPLKTPNAGISYMLPLEERGIEPKDSISWYLWADDFGPTGEVRRSTGDLYFADIRAFDEAYREQDPGAGGQSGASNQGMELLDKQRRITISLFRIKNSATRADDVLEDLDIVQRSQVEALNDLQQLIPQLQEASARQAAMEAQRFMQGTDLGLTNAIDRTSLDPLELAWKDAQSAYQSLVKLTEDEFNVTRSNNQSGGGGPSRNQSQLNELDFRQEESRYETASEAQSMRSSEERQNLELISKLNDLSRRQDDMNQRLQDMQNALAEAQTEEERELIERELRRLQEEQRQLLEAADEAIQQAGNRQSAREARQQLEQARDNMQRASEQLDRGEVSQALASGTRAQDTLDQTREQMRNQNASEFSEAMREARSKARELAERQRQIEEELQNFEDNFQRTLDDSGERSDLSQRINEQGESVEAFLEELQQVAEGAESVEPGLFRELYQVLRDTAGSQFEERYESSSRLLEQGFLREAQGAQEGLSQELEELSESIAEAAEGILGDEGATLQFAQSELESLREQLEQERETNNESDSRSQRGQGQTPSSNPNGERSQQPGDRSPSQSGQRQLSQSTQQSGQSQNGQSNQPSEQSQSDQPSPQSNQGQSGQASSQSNQSQGGQAGGQPSIEEMIRNALDNLQRGASGPITGGSFSDWVDRLSTVESLLEDPLVRGQVTEAREVAESMRRDFKRHGTIPQWEVVENEVAAPLNAVSSWLEDEIRRIENPEALQPIDRDPVPEEYSDIVQRYYESLGNE